MGSTIKFATFFLLISLAISACNAPAPTESAAEPVAPATTETVVVAATEAPIPEASTTPTDAQLQLEIVETHIWTDQSGQFQADVLARNPYDFPVSEFESFITFFDSEGKELLQGIWFEPLDGGLGQILPGETVPASNCLWCSNYEEPDWDSYEIVIRVKEEAPIAYSTDIEVVVGGFDSVGGDYFELAATLENTGDQTLNTVFVSVVVRDQGGNFVGTGETTVYTPEGATGIEPGVPISFLVLVHASLIGEPVLEITAIGR